MNEPQIGPKEALIIQGKRDTVLEVDDLHVYYDTNLGPIKAVNGVSFRLRRGESLGLVGESGSGKSTTVLSLMGLIKPPGRIVKGRILLNGLDIVRATDREIRAVRFVKMSLVPQGAMNSLNPVMKIGEQIADTIRAHIPKSTNSSIKSRITEVLESVDLSPSVVKRYPHELSGGMKQRVCMAMATALRPEVIIADEPTSALDVVVQRQVFETLKSLQESLSASVLLVGHDMGLMAQFVDRVAVMYAGKIVELSPTTEFFEKPFHPYAKQLIDSLPTLGRRRPLTGITGLPPSLRMLPPGCPFHPRCAKAMDQCRSVEPSFVQASGCRSVACHLFPKV